ncbi:MAG: response regulator [Deltaproteobacteria bacterium]|nr:response regulator [Deltaproteobacteria bacterium]
MIDIVEMTVLIADDMPNMVTAIRSMLKHLNFGKTFIPAHDGEEAWNLLKKEPVDLAILDYNMPVMNGAEVLSRIREDRALRDLPVVMVTAQANREFVAEAAESEIDAYILKPATVKVLGDKILNVVRNANSPSPMVRYLKEARQHEESGDIDAAIKAARQAIEANPASSRPPRELGYYYMRKQDLKAAEKWLLKAAEMNPLDVIACHHLGELYVQSNDIESASKYFEKAMQISPRHVGRAVFFGTTLLERKMVQEAVQVFDKALGLSGHDTQLQENIALSCIEKGAKQYGAKLLEALYRQDPNRDNLAARLGITFRELGQFGKALTYLTRAEEQSPKDLALKIHLAKVYLAMGKVIRAEKALKQVLKIDPDNEQAWELIKKCI